MWAPINLDRIQQWIDEGRLPPSSPNKPITARELLLSGCVHNVHDGIKLLGDVSDFRSWLSGGYCAYYTDDMAQGAERLNSTIHITPSRASQTAIKAVENNGGSVFCTYYNPLALRDCIKGRDDRTSAAPTRKQDIGAFSI